MILADPARDAEVFAWINQRVEGAFQRVSKVVIVEDFPRRGRQDAQANIRDEYERAVEVRSVVLGWSDLTQRRGATEVRREEETLRSSSLRLLLADPVTRHV